MNRSSVRKIERVVAFARARGLAGQVSPAAALARYILEQGSPRGARTKTKRRAS